jgi:4-hydroxyphenylpyruvate dioxygenase
LKTSQLAINSVSTRHANLKEALEAYAAAGFENVEFVIPHVKGWMNEGNSLEDVKRLLADLKLRAVGGFEAGVESFSSPEAQEKNHALHLGNAKLIHDLGGGTLVVGTDGSGTNNLEALETVAETFKKLARQIEGLDVAIAIEFNWSPLVKSLKSAALIAAMVDHPQIGVLFDPAHYYVTSTKFEHLTADTVKWIKHCHFNDMRDKPGELSDCNGDRVLPGEGILDLTGLIGRLESFGYDGYFSIEMFNADLWNKPADETARLCYQSMLKYCR